MTRFTQSMSVLEEKAQISAITQRPLLQALERSFDQMKDGLRHWAHRLRSLDGPAAGART